MAAVKPSRLAGYDHEAIAQFGAENMSRLEAWDYPALFWLERLRPTRLLDAGGHFGVKYKAMRGMLSQERLEWIVYDLPAIIRAARMRRDLKDLPELHLVDDLAEIPPCDVLLCSGLMQYLDEPLAAFLRRLRTPARHIVMNKVAVREGPTIFTLETIDAAEAPYCVRNRAAFLDEIAVLGYDVIDYWTIPSIRHVIRSHPHLGETASCGLVARLRG